MLSPCFQLCKGLGSEHARATHPLHEMQLGVSSRQRRPVCLQVAWRGDIRRLIDMKLGVEMR